MPSHIIESPRILSCLSMRVMKQGKVMLWSAVVLMCCWGLSLRPVVAQSFATKVDYPTGTSPFSVAVGDFNSDGKLDLANANSGSNNVSVLLNNGTGTFAAKVDYPTGTNPRSVAVGDFNGDSKPDLAIANNGSNNVSVLLNNGDGTFAAKVDYTTGSAPRSVAVGDFNSDGKPDLATANFNSANVSVLLNNGDGTFAAKVNYTTGSAPSSVTVGDFNVDGKPDLAIANEANSNVSVLLNNGSGTFTAKVDYPTGTDPRSVTVGDFNVDGELDLAIANNNIDNVSVLLNNGNGTFAAHVDYPTDSGPQSVVVGDFNSDGKPDLATANFNSNNVSVLINTGTVQAGFFGTPINNATGTGPVSVAVGDFNSDGKPDLATANQGSVSVLLNNGNGTFAAHVDYPTGTNPESVAVGDFNVDGKPDLVTVNESPSTISILLNNGNGTFAAHVDYSTGRGPASVAVGDFNVDGKPDLVTANVTSDTVSILLNNGNGTFAAHADYPTGRGPISVAVGDFNVDGKPDLVTVNVLFITNNVSILLNNGNGTFARSGYGDPNAAGSVAIGDFNADGKPDLAIPNSVTLSIFINNGDGTFATNVDYPIGTSPNSVAVGDFNADGKLDLALVYSNISSRYVSILFNNGDGTFAAKVDYPIGMNPASLAVGDFNADGKPDLATANVNSNTVSVLINRAAAPTAAASQISGQIMTPDGAPLSGATVTLSGTLSRRTITDNQGYYHFDEVETGGFYAVTPSLVNYTFGPSQRSFSLVADKTDAVFTASPNALITANPLDSEMYFVRQQYLDFLGREPDQGGLDYWSNELRQCGMDQTCINSRRIGVSAAFFMEAEYQQTGSFVYRLYKGALGRRVSYTEFVADRQQVMGGANLDQNRVVFADSFVQRAEFVQRYAGATTAESFVVALAQTMREASGVDLSTERSTLLAKYDAGQSINESRSLVLREAIENASFKKAEYNPSFVLMEYFGYLKREPEEEGYQFWLNVLNNREPNNYRGMVCSFITSAEYQQRFAAVMIHSNQECR